MDSGAQGIVRRGRAELDDKEKEVNGIFDGAAVPCVSTKPG